MCGMIIQKPFVMIGNKKVKLRKGSCKTFNLCYLAQCQLCSKLYTGRTVVELHDRGNGHRRCFKEILKKALEDKMEEIDLTNDIYQLGLHLFHEHGLREKGDFNKHYRVQILEVCSPSRIEKKEHQYIHKYNTLHPIGLNKVNPFGLLRLST